MFCPCHCQDTCESMVPKYFERVECLPNMGNGYVSCESTTTNHEQVATMPSIGTSDNLYLLTTSLKVETATMESAVSDKVTVQSSSAEKDTSLATAQSTSTEASSTEQTTDDGTFQISTIPSHSVTNPQQELPTAFADPNSTMEPDTTSHLITTSVSKSSSHQYPTSTIRTTKKPTNTPFHSPRTTTRPSLSTRTQKALSTVRSSPSTKRGTIHVSTQQVISTTVPTMERRTTPVTKTMIFYELLSTTSARTIASLASETQQSFSAPRVTSPRERGTSSVPTKSITLYEILSKTTAGPTSSPTFGTQQSPSTPSRFHSSTTVERKATSAITRKTTLYEILSTSSVSSTSSIPLDTRKSFSTSSATSTTERKTSPATRSPTLIYVLSKSSASATSPVPSFSSSPAAVTMVSETTPSTRSATLYEILSKSAAPTTDWSTRSKVLTGKPLESGPSLSSSPPEQPIFTTRSGRVTSSPSPFESGTTPSIASTPLEPGMETQETSSEKTLSFKTAVDQEMGSTAVLELGKTTYGAAKDVTYQTTQEALEQSTDHTGATGTAQITDTTVNHLDDPISTAKDSAESKRGNTTVYDFNKASTVTSTSYTEIYASTGILSTLLNRGKAPTTSAERLQLESGDYQSTKPSEEPSDPTLRRTVAPPAEPVAVPSSTSTIIQPSSVMTTSKFSLGGMGTSAGTHLTSKLSSTLGGFGNVSPLSTPTRDPAAERPPTTNATADANLDHSTPESTESQSEVRTTSDSSLQSTTRGE
ncbi:hypothetical protein Q1695_004115 [Nippostrongylus brasiliensis]|nr:hypothetical protein Q1695_004115 [Nippostrongylus brasiliensis]